MARLWTYELVRQALVIPFAVIVRDEVLNGYPQRFLPEADQAIQAGLLDAAPISPRRRSGLETAAVASPTPLQHRPSFSRTQL